MAINLLDDDALARHWNDEEKKEILLLQTALKDKDHKVRFGIYALYAVAALNLITAVVLAFWEHTNNLFFVLNLLEGILFWALAWVARQFPQSAFLIAMAIYLGMVITYAYVDPKSLIRGVLWKMAVVIFLVRGLTNALDRKKILTRLQELGVKNPYDTLL